MENKRKRTQNFTSDEKSLLTELVMKYKNLVENKKSDSATNADKAKGWQRLTKEFNALSSYCPRSPESLKTCWDNIKKVSKKQSASQKREIFKTGGGRPPPPPPNTGTDRIIENILGPALEGLENVYDSDALLDINGKDKKNTNDDTQIDSDTEMDYNNIMSDPSCSFSIPEVEKMTENKKNKIDHQITTTITNASQIQHKISEENDTKWLGWTPNSLKIPVSEVLKKKDNLAKRRRPVQQNLADQLIQAKIDLVNTLKENAQIESKKKIFILEEQLKQEQIKTQKLLTE